MDKRIILLILTTSFVYINCKDSDQKIYEPTIESINYGSIVYASSEVNCKNCHGVDYKGKGPDAKDLDVPVPDLTGVIAPEKTPLDYFKAISVGTEKTKKNGLQYHAYYSLTDKAKWALANYLYSLAQEPKTNEEKKVRQESLAKAMKEVREIYSKNRKWYMGENTPSTEREPSPRLEELIQKTNFKTEQDVSVKIPTEKELEAVFVARQNYEEGYHIYQNHCQKCHGIAGEGVQGSQFLGILDHSRYDAIKGIARRKPAFVGIPPLRNNVKKEDVLKYHSYYLTEEQWNDLINYIKAITE